MFSVASGLPRTPLTTASLPILGSMPKFPYPFTTAPPLPQLQVPRPASLLEDKLQLEEALRRSTAGVNSGRAPSIHSHAGSHVVDLARARALAAATAAENAKCQLQLLELEEQERASVHSRPIDAPHPDDLLAASLMAQLEEVRQRRQAEKRLPPSFQFPLLPSLGHP